MTWRGTGHSTVHAAVMRVPCNAGPRHWLLPGCLRRPARWNPWAMSSRLAAPEISLRYPWDILICRPDTLPILALVTWRASDRSGVLRTKMVPASAIKQIQRDGLGMPGNAKCIIAQLTMLTMLICIHTCFCEIRQALDRSRICPSGNVVGFWTSRCRSFGHSGC